MSDDRDTLADAMAGSARNVALAQAELDRGGPGHPPEQAMLVITRLADTSRADAAFSALHEAEKGGRVELDGIVVVDSDAKGKLHVRKMTDRSTRKGLKWGILGGAFAALFLPATIVGGAIVMGIAGASAGAARRRGRSKEVSVQLSEIVPAGESAILCVVKPGKEDDVEEALAPFAEEIRTLEVDAGTSDAVRAATTATELTEGDAARAADEKLIPW